MLKSTGVFARALSIILMLTLTACGGGGGGDGGGGGGTGFSVRVDRTTLAFNYTQGAAPSATILNVTWTGIPPTQLYLLAQDDANALSPTIPINIGSTSATVTVQPKATLNGGTYTGHLILQVCADPQCISDWSGSPMTVGYTITVTAPVFAGPPAGNFPYTLGQTLSTSFYYQLALPANSGNWTVTATAPWILLSATSGTGAADISVGGDGQGMAVGTYTGSVTVTSANGSQTSTFTLQVSRTTIQATPSVASFSGVNGTSFTPIPVILGFDWSVTPLTVSADHPWIVVSQVSQPSPITDTPGGFVVTVDPTRGPLASGSYSGSVHLTAGSNSDKTTMDFPVNLTLTAPTLTVSPQSIALGGSTGRDFSPATLSLSLNTGTGAYPWTVSGQPSWLNLDLAGGTTPGQVVLTPLRANSVPGTAGATLTFSATVNGDVVTANVPVKFNLDSHRLLAAETGVALVSTPATNWNRLSHDVNIRDNYGLAGPWTAQSDQAWLQVTSSGTAGGHLTLTANPTGLATDQLYTATVTVASSDPTVAGSELIRVGLWVASTAPSGNTSFAGAATFNAVVADPIRPYVYAHETNSTTVRVFNLYAGMELAPITGLPATTVSLTASNDGNTLFALGSGANPVIATANLNTGVAAGVLNIPPPSNSNQPLDSVRYVRTDGRGFIMDGAGRTFRVADGTQVGASGYDFFTVTTDGLAMYSGAYRFPLDYTDAGGGVFSVSSNPTEAGVTVFTTTVGDATNVDGSVTCGPDIGDLICFNGNGATSFVLISQGVSANNTAIGADGRIYLGTTTTYPSDHDVYVYSPAGQPLTSFRSGPYGLGARTFVVSSDGFMLAMATPGTQPSSMLVVPIGP